MHCFMDFKPGGALCQIFAIMYRYKAEQRWRKFDFTVNKNTSRKDPNIAMLQEIESALIETECLRLPVIYFKPDLPKDLVEKMTEIIQRQENQADITEDEEEATHIIYPVVDPLPDDYARPVFRKEKNVMLHWYYFPESYDSWVPANFDLPDNIPESPASPDDKWRVSASWLIDMDQYNEWMSEEDYEVDEQGRKKTHPLRMGVDDLMAGASDEKAKAKPGKPQKRKRSPSPPLKGTGKRKR